MDLQAQFTKLVNRILDTVIGELKNNKEFLSGMGVGAFLMTPPGRKLVKETAKYSKELASLTKDLGKNVATELWKEAVNSKLGKTNFAANAVFNEGKTGTAAEGVFKTTAAMIAGKAIGASLGKTIAAGSNWWQHVNPISATVDIVNVLKEEAAEKKSQKAANAHAQAKAMEVIEAIPNYSATGEANKISVYSGINYDQAAKQLGMSARPKNATAENEWKKEVENNMKRNYRGANTNSPEWYFQGLANKILGTNLTWTGIKDVNSNYDFVSAVGLRCALTMPTENRLLHPQAIANTNIEFQALRGKNTGAYNYGEEDVWSYNIAISSLIAVCRYIGKFLAMNNSFDVQVAKLPVHLLSTVFGYTAAQSIYNDIIANKPNYITRLNSLIKELNTYAYKGRTLNSRWNYLADKCIKDFNGDKAIYGVYNLKIVPCLNAAGNIAYQTLTSFTSVGDYLDYVQQQLDRLRTTKIVAGSSVYVKIAGDMIKLLGATNKTFDNCPYFTGQEVLRFEYDPEANDQLRNAKLVTLTGIGTAPSYDRTTPMDASWDLQGNSSVTFTLASLAKTYYEKSETIIISDRNKEFQPKDNLQMIQFQCTMERHNSGASTGPQYHLKDIGTSLLCDVRVITYGTGSTPVDHDFTGFISIADNNYLKVNGYTTLYGTAANNYSEWITWLSQIDFMPRMQLCKITTSTTDFFNDFLDVDNYAYMTNSQYAMLNNVATYSQTFTFLPDAVKIVGLIAS